MPGRKSALPVSVHHFPQFRQICHSETPGSLWLAHHSLQLRKNTWYPSLEESWEVQGTVFLWAGWLRHLAWFSQRATSLFITAPQVNQLYCKHFSLYLSLKTPWHITSTWFLVGVIFFFFFFCLICLLYQTEKTLSMWLSSFSELFIVPFFFHSSKSFNSSCCLFPRSIPSRLCLIRLGTISKVKFLKTIG